MIVEVSGFVADILHLCGKAGWLMGENGVRMTLHFNCRLADCLPFLPQFLIR